MNVRQVLAFVAIATILSIALPAAAQEGEQQMSPEEQMMMEKWQAYMTPGDPHARIAAMAGSWTYTTRMWHQPGMAPEESTGTAEIELILGGRYALQRMTGPFMGRTFDGMGISGYDNMKQVYQSMWIDNMGTGILTSEGTCEGDVCTYHGDAPDVMLGKYKRVKSIARNVSKDEMVFEMYDTGPDGTEWKNLELVYRRKK